MSRQKIIGPYTGPRTPPPDDGLNARQRWLKWRLWIVIAAFAWLAWWGGCG